MRRRRALFCSRVPLRTASTSASADHSPGRCCSAVLGRVFAIPSVLPHRPYRKDVSWLAQTELDVRAFENAAVRPYPRQAPLFERHEDGSGSLYLVALLGKPLVDPVEHGAVEVLVAQHVARQF